MTVFRVPLAILIFVALYIAATVFFLSRPAAAHTAPSGWSYDLACCSDQDCAPISSDLVRITDEGFVVTVAPGDHPLVTVPTTYVFPHGDPRIRFSGDEDYHLCIGAYSKRGLCLYITGTGA